MRSKLVRVLFCILLSATLIGCGSTETTGTITENAAANEATVVKKTNEELISQYNAVNIVLDDSQITVDGDNISTSESAAVYAANDIVFYLEGQDFTYGEGTEEDEHSQEEADAHTVVHITQPGNYVLSGKLSAGQIAVDLGDGAKKDEDAVVTLILNNVDITCSVAPGVIFYNVYECGSDDEEDATKDVDTSAAGANVIIADGSVNEVNGSYVARIYESVELNEAGTKVVDSEKLHKYDAAFYSRRSMNVNGETNNTGVLNINAENEGLDTELHLTINGGNINIASGNDGINTNEDGISVTTINGGNVNIVVNGSTGEGDGIDSNGWLVINGGNVTALACSFSQDSGIDSDMGIHINGGTVMATGNMLDEIAGSEQNYAVFSFNSSQKAGSTYTLKNEAGTVIGEWTPENDFSMLIFSSADMTEGTYSLSKDDASLYVAATDSAMPAMGGGKGGMMGGKRPEMPEGEVPQDGEMPELPTDGERPEMPEGEAPEMAEKPDNTEMPEKPDNAEMPQMPADGEQPEAPKDGKDGKAPENGEMPEAPQDGNIKWTGEELPELPTDGEMPEGEAPQNGGQPDGGKGFGGGNMQNMEWGDSFTIVSGGNMFMVSEQPVAEQLK